ncbi:MAG: hypothetical protein NC397_08400 [Clostridium sp.]|nr:hypothetical protein [Clostridium sp.]
MHKNKALIKVFLFVVIIVLILSILFAGIKNAKSNNFDLTNISYTSNNIEQETKDEIEKIIGSLESYEIDFGFENEDELNKLTNSIEKSTNYSYVENSEYSIVKLEFVSDGELSFIVYGLPFTVCEFYINDNLCCTYSFD